ncbi:hypothetical protein MATL_G00085170 [Megalops atlanticus]|uniref:Uncharacterized protein n=1 Tax=Megalops atlanticus TaxID=7932 RepID=A0A9D3Q4I4_MEGAT|nr:hypothetical protein MATL_G00085170 [Megalops atlanticus]
MAPIHSTNNDTTVPFAVTRDPAAARRAPCTLHTPIVPSTMRTNTLFIFFITVGLQAAIAASVASDERNEELSDTAEDVSELQKRDQMEFDMAEIEEDQRLEDAHYLEAVGDELTEDADSEAQQGMDNMGEEAEAEAEAEAEVEAEADAEAEEESDSELESESESESESDEDHHSHGVKRDNIEADDEENIAQEE